MNSTTPTTPDKSAPEKGMPENKDFDKWFCTARNPATDMPYGSHLIYRVCDNNTDKFNEAVEILQLAFEAGQKAIPAQETGQQDADYEGTTPSSQKGGCDYMSFSDAKKLFQKYIDCEMRDPNGLDELAKAMLSYNRAISRLSAEKNYGGEWQVNIDSPDYKAGYDDGIEEGVIEGREDINGFLKDLWNAVYKWMEKRDLV